MYYFLLNLYLYIYILLTQKKCVSNMVVLCNKNGKQIYAYSPHYKFPIFPMLNF